MSWNLICGELRVEHFLFQEKVSISSPWRVIAKKLDFPSLLAPYSGKLTPDFGVDFSGKLRFMVLNNSTKFQLCFYSFHQTPKLWLLLDYYEENGKTNDMREKLIFKS